MTEHLTTTSCQRCGARCRVAGPGNQDAKLLRRSAEPKGFCVNCAAHDWLRNTYPVNAILDGSGPKILLHQTVRDEFAGILRQGHADARIDEINWNLIVENWELPFPTKVKRTATNPYIPGVDQCFRSAAEVDRKLSLADAAKPITSFDELDELDPGLGTQLRLALNPVDPEEDPMAKRKSTEVLNVAAHFSNVSIGDQVASIGVKIDRSSLPIEKADECLCGRRLAASVLVMPPGEDVNQKKAFDTGDRHEIAGTFDCKGFNVKPKQIGATLAFSLSEIDLDQLGHVAQKSGRLIVTAVESLPEKAAKGDGDGRDDEF